MIGWENNQGAFFINKLQEEVDSVENSVSSVSDEIGKLSSLNTTHKKTIVGAVNEVNTNVSEVNTKADNLALRVSSQFGFKDKTATSVVISSAGGYSKIGNIYTDFEVPTGAIVVSCFVKGWTVAPGSISLVVSSDGTDIYAMCSDTGTIGSVTVRVWYYIPEE